MTFDMNMWRAKFLRCPVRVVSISWLPPTPPPVWIINSSNGIAKFINLTCGYRGRDISLSWYQRRLWHTEICRYRARKPAQPNPIDWGLIDIHRNHWPYSQIWWISADCVAKRIRVNFTRSSAYRTFPQARRYQLALYRFSRHRTKIEFAVDWLYAQLQRCLSAN